MRMVLSIHPANPWFPRGCKNKQWPRAQWTHVVRSTVIWHCHLEPPGRESIDMRVNKDGYRTETTGGVTESFLEKRPLYSNLLIIIQAKQLCTEALTQTSLLYLRAGACPSCQRDSSLSHPLGWHVKGLDELSDSKSKGWAKHVTEDSTLRDCRLVSNHLSILQWIQSLPTLLTILCLQSGVSSRLL